MGVEPGWLGRFFWERGWTFGMVADSKKILVGGVDIGGVEILFNFGSVGSGFGVARLEFFFGRGGGHSGWWQIRKKF